MSTTGGKTYVYFTCNGQPGGVYSYCLEDDAVTQIYVPDQAHQQYCTSTVVADAQGNLYYANDSGALFSLAPADSWKVTFDSCGGSAVETAYVAKGQALTRPADPAREGFSFAGWYADEACTQPWDFTAAPSGDMKLFAKWTASDSAAGNVSGGTVQTGGVAGSQGAASSPANVVKTVLVGKTVLSAAGTPAKAEAETASTASEEALKDVAESSAQSRSAEPAAASAGAADAEQSTQGGSMPWWPFVGLAVGVCGLAAALVWAMKARKANGR